MNSMVCRKGCGACCIAPSLSSAIPGMQGGKPAGVPCIHLTPELTCAIYRHPDRPAVCASFPALADHCGSGREEALALLAEWERRTGGGTAISSMQEAASDKRQETGLS